MKKYLFSALALGMMLTSCQSDEPFAPGEGGEKQVTFTLNVPGDLGTRSGATGNNSGVGGFSNGQGSLYYTLVLHANGDTQVLKNATISADGRTATFTPTVVLGRDYTITAYASFDDNASINNKADIEAITVSKNFNDESKDVYFYTTTHNFAGDNLETLELKRPFGKLRLVATDYKAEGNGNTAIKSVRVKYNNNVFTTFNAVSGEFSGGKSYEYTLEGTDYSTSYYAPEKDENGNVTGQTIFADYIPVQKNGDHAAPFEITVEYNDGETYTREFTQDIPVRRNALTTLKGNFFTAGAEITVTVDDAFDVNMEKVDGVDGVFTDVNGNYYISNANGLKWVASEVNKYSNYEHPFEEETIYLLNDIDLGGMEWTPIGDYRFSANRFCGTFDGQGHTISNFKITKKTDKNDSNKSSYGFFGNLEGTVKNLTIANATVNSYAYTGALVGRLNSGLIENCHVISSTVSNTYWQGGILIGQVNGEGNNPVVKNCSVKNSSIKSKSAIGAIAGPVTATEGAATFEECYVENCQVIQEGSFGGSYDNYFGSMFGYLEADANSRIDVNNCSVENVTVKGEDNAPISGGFDGNIYVNGGQPVATATELAAAIQAGGSYTLVNDIALDAPIQVSDKTFYLNGNGNKISQSTNYPDEGTQTTALIHPIRCTATIENVVFDGLQVDGPIRTVDTKLTINNVTVKNCKREVTGSTAQGLFRLHGESTVTNCVFTNNTCPMAISLNWDGNNDLPQKVENCVFKKNTCISTAVLYYVKGSGCVVNNNKFTDNNVTVTEGSNAATVYMGFTENNMITNNLFQNNTVNAGTSKRVAGGLMIGYAAVVTGNAFIDNTVNATNAKGNDVCASVYYTDIDLSGNYWGGNAPVENDDYFVEYPDMHNVIINNYLTVNPIK